MKPLAIYKKLLKVFGPQGWWPMDNSFEPKEWEICLGAILTQNTSWTNVEKTLSNIKSEGHTKPEHILNLKNSELEKILKPSGFYKQKAERLRTFAKFVAGFKSFSDFSEKITRENLLEIKGIGPETADSILLYACGRPVFVIDAYTKRFYSRFYGKNISDYNELQKIFQSSLPRDVNIYKEFHALIVTLAKKFCRKKPICRKCPLSKKCLQFISQKSPYTSNA